MDMYRKTLRKAAMIESVRVIQSSRTPAPQSGTSRTSTTPVRRSTPAPSSSSAPTVATGSKKKYWPKLTDEERKLLIENNGCFACRKVNAGHIAPNCPEFPQTRGAVKKEIVSIVNGYVVRHAVDTIESEPESSYSSVPVVTVPIRIQNAEAINSGIDSGATINVISPRMVKKHRLAEQPAPPVKIHQAMDPNGTIYNTKVVSIVTLPSEKWTSAHKYEFTVAPLLNHDALLGMPSLTKEAVLVDPANRSLILPENDEILADMAIDQTSVRLRSTKNIFDST